MYNAQYILHKQGVLFIKFLRNEGDKKAFETHLIASVHILPCTACLADLTKVSKIVNPLLPFAPHYNSLLIRNHSRILTINKNRIFWTKISLKKNEWFFKMA